ncbi:MAG: gliding motility-associated C-terminal domain-containing protein [Prevotellaceae bacterium]|jgi:gliding motility-associated-like protein/uncharacterized repeat protein (TIGR01451 family)|nr:gliding motility-associated C-terminal domain-containing protein [Prevotellaceae bacterium]
MQRFIVHIGKKVAATLAIALCVLFSARAASAQQLQVEADMDELRQGEELTLTVTVYNYDTVDVTDFQVLDSLHRGTLFVACSAEEYTSQGRNILVKIPHLFPNESYTYTLTLRMERKGSLEKTLLLQKGGEMVEKSSVQVDVLTSDVLDIKVNMFTPNGDGVNDYFEIPGIFDYPNNEIVIFNRFSDRVYQARSYSNNWSAEGRPDGNYFYVLTLNLDNGTVQKYNGYVTVKR